MDLEGIILNDKSDREYHIIVWFHLCGILKKKTRDHRYKEQIGGCQRQEGRKKGGRLQKVQTFSYKISHGDIIYSILCVCVLVTQLCLTLCDPMDCSPPSSSVHGILQVRTLVAIPFSNSIVNRINNTVLHIWKLLKRLDLKSSHHKRKIVPLCGDRC